MGNYTKVLKDITARVEKENMKNAQLAKQIQAKKDKSNEFAHKGGRLRLVAKRMKELAEDLEEEMVDVRKEDKTIRPFTIPHQPDLIGEMDVPVRKIRAWQRASLKTASLDAPLTDLDSSKLSDLVPDDGLQDPYQQLEEETTHSMLRSFLGILDSRELAILEERFGLSGGKEKTLDEIGHRFGVTRERIRQLQNIALAKLRERIERHEAVVEPNSLSSLRPVNLPG